MLPTKRMIQRGMKVSSFTCCDNLFLPTILSDIRLFSPSTTSDSLCDADSDNKGSASFDDLFSSNSSYNSSCKSNIVHFNDDKVTTIHATHKKDDSAWNKGIIIYNYML